MIGTFLSDIELNPKQVLSIELKDGRIFDVSQVRGGEFVYKSLIGEIFSNCGSFVEKRNVVEKSVIVGVGKNFVILKGGVCVKNPCIVDSKSIDVEENSFANFMSLKDNVGGFVEKKSFVGFEQDGDIVYRKILVEEEKLKDDNF